MIDAHTPSEKDAAEFNSYMLFKLQSSSAFVEHLEQRNQQTINFYIVLLTALIGGGAVAITTISDLPTLLSIIAFGLFFIGAYGMLTYMWLLATITEELHESFIQSFLYKYFRDMNPIAFEKYGLSEFLFAYRTIYEHKRLSSNWLSRSATPLLLGIFSSTLIGIATYVGSWVLNRVGNLLLSIGMGIVCLAITCVIWFIQRRRVFKERDKGRKILDIYHKETGHF